MRIWRSPICTISKERTTNERLIQGNHGETTAFPDQCAEERASDIWLIFPRFSVEYEYLYVNGDIDIDEIYSKSTRKRKGSYDNSSLVVMAPTGSAHLDGYQNRQGIKMLDYSSREPNVKTWTLVYGDGSDQKMLILELPDEVVQDMRRYSPQKVYLQ